MYDKATAKEHILKEMKNHDLSIEKEHYEKLAQTFIELDFEYMKTAGLLDEKSKGFYDDEAAFNHITKGIGQKFNISTQKSQSLTDVLMEIMEDFLDNEDMFDWQ
jgi:hypothetical protein